MLLSDIHERLGDLGETQGGFRKKRSTLDLALALDVIIVEHDRRGKLYYRAFLDIKGAYNSIGRLLLCRSARKRARMEPFTRLLKIY